ncbi:MAG: hypothetical protein ABL925_03670 [Methylococcales bacterium]
MKLIMKITPPSQVAQEQSIFRHCYENDLSLTRNKKTAQCGDTAAARQDNCRPDVNQLSMPFIAASKDMRGVLTDAIQEYIVYAEAQGSSNARKYYLVSPEKHLMYLIYNDIKLN